MHYWSRMRRPHRSRSPSTIGPPTSAPGSFGDEVTVTINTWKCPPDLLLRAVHSILDQTYENLTLLVLSDADPDVHGVLEKIWDPRLFIHEFPVNQGPMFGHDVALRCADTPFFAVQDADDWSEPQRLSEQIQALCEHEADFAMSGVLISGEGGKNRTLWPNPTNRAPYPFLGSHIGVHRTSTLLSVGGYWWGLRYSGDAMVPLLIRHHGRIAALRKVLYHYCRRPESNTMAPATKLGSPRRLLDRNACRSLYSQLVDFPPDEPARTAELLQSQLTEDQRELRDEQVEAVRAMLTERKALRGRA